MAKRAYASRRSQKDDTRPGQQQDENGSREPAGVVPVRRGETGFATASRTASAGSETSNQQRTEDPLAPIRSVSTLDVRRLSTEARSVAAHFPARPARPRFLLSLFPNVYGITLRRAGCIAARAVGSHS